MELRGNNMNIELTEDELEIVRFIFELVRGEFELTDKEMKTLLKFK